MKEIQKSLKKLELRERKIAESLIEKLISLNWIGLDIAKLKGTTDLFRVRKGHLRIIFKYKNDQVNIIAIDRRSEKTYKKF